LGRERRVAVHGKRKASVGEGRSKKAAQRYISKLRGGTIKDGKSFPGGG